MGVVVLHLLTIDSLRICLQRAHRRSDVGCCLRREYLFQGSPIGVGVDFPGLEHVFRVWETSSDINSRGDVNVRTIDWGLSLTCISYLAFTISTWIDIRLSRPFSLLQILC